jgi:invasion protein IalB
MKWGVVLAVLAVGTAYAQTPSGKTEDIGSWVVACPADAKSAPCRMRYQKWIVPPQNGRPSIALEVRNTGAQMVPQLAVRDLPAQLAMAAMMAATPTMELKFDGGQKLALSCGSDADTILCTPEPGAAAEAAAQLKTAKSVQVRVHVTLAGSDGPSPIPDQTRSFDLSRTAAAIDRFRAVAPEATPLPTASSQGNDMRAMADKMLKAMGYSGGVNDIMQKAMVWMHSMMGRTPQS